MAGGPINWYGDPVPATPSITPTAAGIFDYFRGSGERAVADTRATGLDIARAVGNPAISSYQPSGPVVGQGPDGTFYVQGQTIKPGDYASAVDAEGLLNKPRQGELPAGITSLSPEAYRQYVASIKNPTTWNLAKKSLGIGADVTQQSLGRAIQTAGVGWDMPGLEQFGKGIADTNTEELRMTSPYERPWGTSSFGDYLIGLTGQTLPRMAAGMAGGAVGSLVGPEGTMGGFLAGSGLVNYPLAVGDVAQRQMEVNGKIDPGAAAGWGVPYAAADVLTDYLPIGQALGKFGLHGVESITGRGLKAGVRQVGKRLVVGGAEGAIAEGIGEGSQEFFQRAGAGQSLNDAEAWNAYMENAAGGALLGGIFGGGGRLFAKPPAQTGEEVRQDKPTDLLNQPSQRALPPPGAPNLPGGGGQRAGYWGTNQTGRGVGPYWGDPNIVEGEWTDVPPPPPGPPGLPPAGPRGLPPGPGGPAGLAGPGGQLLLTGPAEPTFDWAQMGDQRLSDYGRVPGQTYGPALPAQLDPDLFGQPRYTNPVGQPTGAPTGPVAPTAGPGTMSAAEFYNQTPMGQYIGGQTAAEYAATPSPLPPVGTPMTLAEQLSQATGRPTPEQVARQQAAQIAAQQAATRRGALNVAGQTALEQITGNVPTAPVGRRGTGTAVDFRVNRPAPSPVTPAPKAAPLRRGKKAVVAAAPVAAPVEAAPTKVIVTDTKVERSPTDGAHTVATLSDGTTATIYKDAQSDTWRIDFGKTEGVKDRSPDGHDGYLTGGNKVEAIAALPEKLAWLRAREAGQVVTPTPPVTGGEKLRKGKAKKTVASAVTAFKAKARDVLRRVVEDLRRSGELKSSEALKIRGWLQEKNLTDGDVRNRIKDITKFSDEDMADAVATAEASLAREGAAKAEANVSRETSAAPKGKAQLQGRGKPAAPKVEELSDAALGAKIVHAQTQEEIAAAAHEATGGKYAAQPAEEVDAKRKVSLSKRLTTLAKKLTAYTREAIGREIDRGNLDRAEQLMDYAKRGGSIDRVLMTKEDRDAQQAKIDARPEQKSSDTEITGGIDEERARLESAINFLAQPQGNKKARLSPEAVTSLKGYLAGKISNEQLYVRIAAAAGGNRVLENAMARWTNKKAEAEQKGENAYKVTAEALQKAADEINARFGNEGKKVSQGKVDEAAAKGEKQATAGGTKMPNFDEVDELNANETKNTKTTKTPPKQGKNRGVVFDRDFGEEDKTAFRGDGISAKDTMDAIKPVLDKWRRAPGVTVYETHAALPPELRDQVQPTSKGFFDRSTGKVGLIAENIRDAADARSTLYHEALGHFGLWNRFTTRLNQMLQDIYRTNAKVRATADALLDAKDWEKTPANIARATEEVLAESLSFGPGKLSAAQRIASYVRSMGRFMGLVQSYSDADIASIMHKAQNYTMRSDGPVTFMNHADADDFAPDVMERDATIERTMQQAPAYIRENATTMARSAWDGIKNFAPKVMLSNQLLDDWLPSVGATAAKRVASLVRNRDSMTTVLMEGARKWAADTEKEDLGFRRRSKGIGTPELDNFSGFVETMRRRGKWGYFPEERFTPEEMDTAKERFHRGKFNSKGEQTEDALLDPELEAAFKAFSPKQQQIIKDFHAELFHMRDLERETLATAMRDSYLSTKASLDEKISEMEHDLGIAQETEGFDKAKLRKMEAAHEIAVGKRAEAERAYDRGMRDLFNKYRDMEYTPYAPTQRHGRIVVVAMSKALNDAHQAQRRGETRPEGAPSIYAMEANPDHYFVHAVDSLMEANQLKAKLEAAPEFAGGRITHGDSANPGEELFAGSDLIAGLQKLLGNIGTSGETSAINNTIMAMAQRTIIEAMSANSARKADLYFRNIRSAPLDMPKAFMSRMLSSSQFLSAFKYNAEINRALRESADQIKYDVPQEHHSRAKAALNDFVGRYNDDLTPKSEDTIADILTGISSTWMLTMSPSYYVQQVMQNATITMPYLSGRFGAGNVTKAFKIGYDQALKALEATGGGSKSKGVMNYLANGMLDISAVDEKYREMLRFMQNSGLLDVSMNLEMGRVSSDISTGPWDKAKRAVRNSVRGVEANNRIAAAIASFELMHNQGAVTPETISNLLGVDQKAFNERYADYLDNHETLANLTDRNEAIDTKPLTRDQFAAAEYARQIILDTHGDYSSSNKPKWTRRGIGRIATQYRTFNAMMVGTYAKTMHRAFFDGSLTKAEKLVARKTLMYMTGSTALFAGVNGLPAAGLFGLLYTMFAGMGGDEPPEDYQQTLREAVGDPYIANLLLYGVPSILGLNVSGSMGMGNLLSLAPSADMPTDRTSAMEYILALFGGPSISGVGLKMYDAYDLWANKGQTYKAMETAMPRVLQGIARAYHDAHYGVFAGSGDMIVSPQDISMAETLWGTLGFSSADRSARQWSRSRAFTETEYFSNTGASIKRNYVEAHAAGDSKAMASAREEWQVLQGVRQKFGLEQQPLSALTSAPAAQAKREKQTISGIQYSGTSKGQALRLGQMSGAAPPP